MASYTNMGGRRSATPPLEEISRYFPDLEILESIDADDISPGMPLEDPAGGAVEVWFDCHWALAVMERGLDFARN